MTRRRPLPRSRQALRSTLKEVRDLWEAKDRDPADLPQRVAKFQLWQARKRAGKLPMYETIGRK